jgi:hypothetical protein
MLLFSINRSRGYENPSLDIIVTERCSIGGCPLEEACEHCYLIQSAISVAISYIISVYCEDYAGYFTVILSFLAFHFCSAYFIYLVSCSRSQKNLISAEVVKQLGLSTTPHPQPYNIGWLRQGRDLHVNQQCRLSYNIQPFKDEVLCDVAPLDVCDVLLGQPYMWKHHAIYES